MILSRLRPVAQAGRPRVARKAGRWRPPSRMARLEKLKEVCPQLVMAKTLLAGHFNTIEVSDQINAMLNRFLKVGI